MSAVPPAVSVPAAVLGLDSHPLDRAVIALGRVDGVVEVRRFEKKWITAAGDQPGPSARVVQFATDGASLLAGRSDGALMLFDVESQMQVTSARSASKTESDGQQTPGLTALLAGRPALAITGDDEGGVQAWDFRLPSSLACHTVCKPQTDYIAALDSLDFGDNCLTTLAASADGTLAVLDWRSLDWQPPADDTTHAARKRNKKKTQEAKPKPMPGWTTRAVSEDVEDELLSMAILKHGRKIVCGSQEGVLQIYSTGAWMDVTDRFPGHPRSVEAIAKIDEETILTGSSDGLVRIVQVQPNRLLGVLAEHADFPIERMKLSCDKSFLATTSHDDSVRFHDLSILAESDQDEEEPEEAGESESEVAATSRRAQQSKKRRKNQKTDEAPTDFFDGL